MTRIRVFWDALADISAETDPLLPDPSHLKPCVKDCFLASHLALFLPVVIMSELKNTIYWILLSKKRVGMIRIQTFRRVGEMMHT